MADQVKKLSSLMIQIEEYFDTHERTVMVEGIPMQVIKKLLRIMGKVPDFRKQHMITYELKDVLLLAFLAMLGGAEGYTEMEDFWKEQKRLYKRLMKRKPLASHDTFRRVIGGLEGSVLNTLLVEVFLESAAAVANALGIPLENLRIINIDGKELCGSGRLYGTEKEVKNLQLLNVYDQTHETCLYSIPIDQKHNEIPHAQAVLEAMQLTDTIVTADALHAQQKTVCIIHRQGGDFLIGLKGNQQLKHQAARELFDESTKARMRCVPNQCITSVEKAHNQVETRRYYLKRIPQLLLSTEFAGWDGLRSVLCIEKQCVHTVTQAVSRETRYYLTSLVDLVLASAVKRCSWSVENRLHWLLDTVMTEDANHTVDRNAARNLSMMKKMCLSLYKLMNSTLGIGSVRRTRKRFAWNFLDNLARVLTLLDEASLRKALNLS